MVELITVEDSGVPLVGLILRRSHRFVEVEITSPYSGLRTDVTLPLFATDHVSLLGPDGNRCATAMLKRLHRQGEFMAAHREHLRQRWRISERSLDELRSVHRGSDVAALHDLRIELRRRFQRGALGQRAYQVELRRLTRLQSAYEDRRRMIFDAFMADWSSGLDLAQVLEFIGQW